VVASASQAADEFTVTARQINVLIDANRYSLAATLDNINQTSAQLRSTVQSLDQATTRVTQGDLLRNLEALSVNAAQASANLRDASQSLNNPANLTMLQQTLDAARDTFLNARKITAELDDLTGDPAFRDNLRNLINGLSRLLSSTQQLQQQARVTQLLVPLANQSSRAASSTANIPPNTPNLVPPETLPQETNPQPSNVPTQAP
jgi:phospholipid/cholesterol/gamma-HCH transport system substrate-binding protein